ncbi:DUF975 family protein [Lentilactobacillus otakiensis]|uniref:Integral membrane protein n=1 Tax=Lentilactobacillus otakiensis DSM 19908 = JCM 15040 TaxID=1423780 RepID=S4NGZ3_9LACO|nr:DUF975 family protein [Lentilactobacillus otakiensis]KRL10091.1 hypothetical protein FD05_GL000207 [Lentilactobacillus otakiensis DSM 19908 = JCM 15040]MDV3517942.1 DUF975 family protein [Lentilactobacillus otakiensis]GAD16497.1 integral membrane protein [Lentilactobacillus otakiensis DSM 19908 = JCM 15040]
MDRVGLKLEAKRIINSHFPFFILLFLPAIIIQLGYSVAYSMNPLHQSDIDLAMKQIVQGTARFGSNEMLNLWGISTVISIVSGLLLSGMMFVCIDIIRNKVKFDAPVTKSFTILNNGQYFIGAIMMGIITTVLTLLWSILLIIPGIIKGFAYSQALYIYRDSVDAGKPISYLDAITQSRKMMDGHKMEYFVMALSFIGWYILNSFTYGILLLWLQPYYQLSFANFYVKVSQESK